MKEDERGCNRMKEDEGGQRMSKEDNRGVLGKVSKGYFILVFLYWCYYLHTSRV